MKKLVLSIIVLLLAVSLIAASVPPALPSSFYGMVTGTAKTGDTVQAVVSSKVVATINVFLWEGQKVYAINVPGDASTEGKTITFKIRSKVVGSGVWHSGTNVHVDLKRK